MATTASAICAASASSQRLHRAPACRVNVLLTSTSALQRGMLPYFAFRPWRWHPMHIRCADANGRCRLHYLPAHAGAGRRCTQRPWCFRKTPRVVLKNTGGAKKHRKHHFLVYGEYWSPWGPSPISSPRIELMYGIFMSNTKAIFQSRTPRRKTGRRQAQRLSSKTKNKSSDGEPALQRHRPSGKVLPVFFGEGRAFFTLGKRRQDFSRQGESLRLIPFAQFVFVSTSSTLSQKVSCS